MMVARMAFGGRRCVPPPRRGDIRLHGLIGWKNGQPPPRRGKLIGWIVDAVITRSLDRQQRAVVVLQRPH